MTDLKLTTKEYYQAFLIPGLNELIQLEKIHYELLCNNEDLPIIDAFKKRCQKSIDHLIERLTEYTLYAETLP